MTSHSVARIGGSSWLVGSAVAVGSAAALHSRPTISIVQLHSEHTPSPAPPNSNGISRQSSTVSGPATDSVSTVCWKMTVRSKSISAGPPRTETPPPAPALVAPIESIETKDGVYSSSVPKGGLEQALRGIASDDASSLSAGGSGPIQPWLSMSSSGQLPHSAEKPRNPIPSTKSGDAAEACNSPTSSKEDRRRQGKPTVVQEQQERSSSCQHGSGDSPSTTMSSLQRRIVSGIQLHSPSGSVASIQGNKSSSSSIPLASQHIFRAVFLGTDDDYLSLTHIRKVFELNALSPEDMQLFEISREMLLEEGIVLPELLDELGMTLGPNGIPSAVDPVAEDVDEFGSLPLLESDLDPDEGEDGGGEGDLVPDSIRLAAAGFASRMVGGPPLSLSPPADQVSPTSDGANGSPSRSPLPGRGGRSGSSTFRSSAAGMANNGGRRGSERSSALLIATRRGSAQAALAQQHGSARHIYSLGEVPMAHPQGRRRSSLQPLQPVGGGSTTSPTGSHSGGMDDRYAPLAWRRWVGWAWGATLWQKHATELQTQLRSNGAGSMARMRRSSVYNSNTVREGPPSLVGADRAAVARNRLYSKRSIAKYVAVIFLLAVALVCVGLFMRPLVTRLAAGSVLIVFSIFLIFAMSVSDLRTYRNEMAQSRSSTRISGASMSQGITRHASFSVPPPSPSPRRVSELRRLVG
ncbi:hypothetical protein BC828DRAFT_263469 [Blastocladiella britannica]|nr:hypothetical protein BC828DRAFT_263469 [Blastocladiella britannica]